MINSEMAQLEQLLDFRLTEEQRRALVKPITAQEIKAGLVVHGWSGGRGYIQCQFGYHSII